MLGMAGPYQQDHKVHGVPEVQPRQSFCWPHRLKSLGYQRLLLVAWTAWQWLQLLQPVWTFSQDHQKVRMTSQKPFCGLWPAAGRPLEAQQTPQMPLQSALFTDT